MDSKNITERINIRPGVSILSVLRHLNYKPWFAMAEFVDNSIQSYLDHREQLQSLEGGKAKLKVEIELDTANEGFLTVRDNAGGIHENDFPRAFRPAALPPDRSGLCEFGMGMKSAACWFALNWKVRTSALGEPIERSVYFDIEKIVEDQMEELTVKTTPTKANNHYTEIMLSNLNKKPQTKTLIKIKEHLSSIYRSFIRDGILELWFNKDLLDYVEPKVLCAPYYKDKSGQPKEWKKEIDFDLGLGLEVQGFAAIREVASTSTAGFALFRHNRVIQGSGDEAYRPEAIFGKPNSFAYQRLFGELHLKGFEVSHTKDGFRWEEHEEIFLELLKEVLDEESLPLLSQIHNYRVKTASVNKLRESADIAIKRTGDIIQDKVPPILQHQLEISPEREALPPSLPKATAASTRVIDVELRGEKWKIVLDLSVDPAVGDWLSVSEHKDKENSKKSETIRQVSLRLALHHPFSERFSDADTDSIESLLRLAAALGLAEIAARDRGVKEAGTIRRIVNELLRNALSE